VTVGDHGRGTDLLLVQEELGATKLAVTVLASKQQSYHRLAAPLTVVATSTAW